MADRYNRLYTLEENLYATGSPIVISAGALLLDTQTQNAIVQLKLLSLSDKIIKSVSVKITAKDTAERVLGDDITYSYLDLNVSQGNFFGAKTPVILPDNSTRCFSVKVSEVIFENNQIWSDKDAKWVQIPTQTELATVLYPYALKTFKQDYNSNAKYLPCEFKDITLCACGAVNKSDSNVCCACGIDFKSLLTLDYKQYNNDKKYENAVLCSKSEKSEEINHAIGLFETLSDWKDCTEEIAFCKAEIERLQKIEEENIKERKHKEELERKESERVAKRNKKITIIIGLLHVNSIRGEK
ncbi:MAG: hypothetical protein E7540_06590 [Ruminococcaceae bacterium]|nr:hypothetical protein [Oscillospiraceae bacterium]